MGGSKAAQKPPRPNIGPSMADMQLMRMMTQSGTDALKRQNEIALQKASQPMEVMPIDIYGPSGALNKMSATAAINALKSKELERLTNPEAAKIREQIGIERAASMNPNYWQNQMGAWAKQTGF
jgi:hypothetical protein